jgi:hypothetical protein
MRVTDGHSVDTSRVDVQPLEIVQQHSTALAGIEKQTSALRLDQKRHPVFTPQAGTTLHCVVNDTRDFHGKVYPGWLSGASHFKDVSDEYKAPVSAGWL